MNRSMFFGPHLVEDVPVEVRHVALVRERPLVIIFEMLLKGHGVMRDPHHGAQVVGQHLHTQNRTIRAKTAGLQIISY